MAITEKTKRKLWAASGGFCANPDCHAELFHFFDDGNISNIEEFAHIIGKKEDGPRGNHNMSRSDRDNFDNILLLCPTCHSLIDKNPKKFSDSLLISWKQCHQDNIRSLFAEYKFKTRKDIHDYLEPILKENSTIFNEYGPYSNNAKTRQLESELKWNQLSIKKILPNNRKIERTIQNNIELLTPQELNEFSKFKLHVEGFEYNKISGDVNSVYPTFPKNFERIFDENKQ